MKRSTKYGVPRPRHPPRHPTRHPPRHPPNTHLNLSCLVLSCLVLMPCLVLSCLASRFCLVLSCRVLRFLVLCCVVLSCFVLFSLALSCLDLSSCLDLFCLVLHSVVWCCLVLSYPVAYLLLAFSCLSCPYFLLFRQMQLPTSVEFLRGSTILVRNDRRELLRPNSGCPCRGRWASWRGLCD